MNLKSIKQLLLILSAVGLFNNVMAVGTSSKVGRVSKVVTTNFVPQTITDRKVLDYFHQLLPTTIIDSVYTTPYPDTYALVIGVNLVYGNLHSSYLTSGHMFNIYTQDDITEKLQKMNAPKIDVSKINIADAVLVKSPNKVNKKLIIFIDPDCPYCKQLEQQIILRNISKKANIYYMLMPLSMHPNAKEHSKNILCSTNSIKILEDYMIKNNENPEVKLIPNCNIEPLLERTGSIARSININATPVIITGAGDLIMGVDIEAISNYLSKE